MLTLVLTDNEKIIENLYAHKTPITKTKGEIKFEDGTRILVKKSVKALKGYQADQIILDKKITPEQYERTVKTRVNSKNGVVINLE